MIKYKVCRKCKLEKEIFAFSSCSRNKDRFRSYCKECDNAANKAWYKKNKERNKQRSLNWKKENQVRFREYQRQWQENNKENRRSYCAQWYQENKDNVSYKHKLWWDSNPEKRRLYKHRYYGKIKDQLGEVSSDIVQKLFMNQKGLCYYCGIDLAEWHLEHMFPVSRGGYHDDLNLCLSCPSCNLRKQNKTAEEFIRQLKEEASWQ